MWTAVGQRIESGRESWNIGHWEDLRSKSQSLVLEHGQ
jgi:hypothetical protein